MPGTAYAPSHSEPLSRSASPAARKRKHPGCVTCRARRITCDRAEPVCEHCQQGGFDCIPSDVTTPASAESTSTRPPRERTRLACLPCRSRKIRCAGPSLGPDSPCPRCQRLSLECLWAVKRYSAATAAEDTATVSPGSLPNVLRSPSSDRSEGATLSIHAALANKQELRQIVQLYFSTVHHYGFLGFIHEPSFSRLLEADKAPRELTAMMVACTLRFACDPTPLALARADNLFEETIRTVHASIYDGYGAIDLMTMMLARVYEYSRGRFASAWLLWGNVVRMMQFLSLHTFDDTYPHYSSLRLNPLLKREALRRLAWAVFYHDTVADAGRHGVHLLTESGFHIQLPCDEPAFLRGLEVVTATLNQPLSTSHPLGLSAHIIRAAAMRRRVLHFNSLIKHSTAPPQQMLEELAAFEDDLKRKIAELPPDLVYTVNNMFIHSAARTAFVNLHLLRHNCFLMLALARINACSRDPTLEAMSTHFRYDRIKHAIPVSRIVSDILRLEVNCDPKVGVQAYSSLEILLFDPLRLSQTDPTINPKEDRFVEALKVLMALIRREALRYVTLRLLRIEACRRLIRCGFESLTTQSDREACKPSMESTEAGRDDDEFDFRAFAWHRTERRTTSTAQSLLHLGNLHSAAASPPSENILDAGEVINQTPAASRLVPSGDFPPTAFSSDIGPALNGLDEPLTAQPPNPFAAMADLSGPVIFNNQRRWEDFDYDYTLDLQSFEPGPVDDFQRFMEQVGVAGAEESVPFLWTPSAS